jgi:hypothetical protein
VKIRVKVHVGPGETVVKAGVIRMNENECPAKYFRVTKVAALCPRGSTTPTITVSGYYLGTKNEIQLCGILLTDSRIKKIGRRVDMAVSQVRDTHFAEHHGIAVKTNFAFA